MLPSRLASIALPFFATVALAAPAAAAELDLDMQFVAPGAPYTGDQTPIDTPFTMVLSYNFDPHVWTNVTLTLTLPNKTTHPRIAIGTTAEPANTFGQGQITAGAADTIVWTGTPAANTGISGQIVVTLTAESWSSGLYGPAIDGTPYGFSATLTGTADGGAVPETVTATGSRTGIGNAVVAWRSAARGRAGHRDAHRSGRLRPDADLDVDDRRPRHRRVGRRDQHHDHRVRRGLRLRRRRPLHGRQLRGARCLRHERGARPAVDRVRGRSLV